MRKPDPLTRREREIMDILHRRGRATAHEVMDALADPPSYSAVRTFLRLLEERGHVRHEQDGPRYVYTPTVARREAQRSAITHLVDTFFDGSVGRGRDAGRVIEAEAVRAGAGSHRRTRRQGQEGGPLI